jgi:drug/metabolite transporter (DMT)-like permease
VDRRRATGIVLVVLSAFAFGSGSLFAKPAYDEGLDWHTLSTWRFLFGAGLAWAWLLVQPAGRAAVRGADRRLVLTSLALGLLYLGNSGTYYAGLETVDASLAALIVYVYPAVVAVLTLRYGRRLEGRRAWGALVLALVGVALAVGGIRTDRLPPLDGLMLIVVSPLIYSVWIILAARLSGERPASTTQRDDAREGAAAGLTTALMMTATAGGYLASALAVGRPVLPAQIPADLWPNLIGVGVVATFVAIQTFYAGAQRVGAAQASLISTIEPVWTISLAALLLGESLEPVQLVGGALILIGVVVAQTRPRAALDAPRVRVADE